MSYFRSGDPLDDFDRLDREYTKWLEGCPVCDICDKHIQDEHYYLIFGDVICPDCLDHFKKRNDR